MPCTHPQGECHPAFHQRWHCKTCGGCWRCGRGVETIVSIVGDDVGPADFLSDIAARWAWEGAQIWTLDNEPLPPRCLVIMDPHILTMPDGTKVTNFCHGPAVVAVKDHNIAIHYWCGPCWSQMGGLVSAAVIDRAKREARGEAAPDYDAELTRVRQWTRDRRRIEWVGR